MQQKETGKVKWFNTKKGFGQNLLIDDNILKKIASSLDEKDYQLANVFVKFLLDNDYEIDEKENVIVTGLVCCYDDITGIRLEPVSDETADSALSPYASSRIVGMRVEEV